MTDIQEAISNPIAFYCDQIDRPHGKLFAETVGRFQEGFLKDQVVINFDDAFARAVETAARLMPAIIIQAEWID